MLTSIRGLTAATLSAGFLLSAAPAFAEEAALDATTDATTDASTDTVGVVIADAAVEGAAIAAPISEEIIAASAALDLVATDALPVLSTNLVARAAEPIDEATVNRQEAASGVEISGNVALVSDYRFRGVSLSGGDFALQGGIDVGHSSGFYVGTWASSITGGTPFGELEVDVYAGWSGDVAEGITFDAGLLYYIYPTGDFANVETDYFEPYASIGFAFGPASATVGVAYAWEQDSLGGNDNIYVYTDLEVGIPNTPITVAGHLGYTDGALTFTTDGNAFDWGLSATWAVTDSLSLGVSYVDVEDDLGALGDKFTDAGFFFTLGYSM